MKSTRLCLGCGKAFVPLLHVPRQRYCPSEQCQRARRRDWQRNRLRNDSDYRDNQARAQEKWRAGHPDYWRKYRAAHPAYRERNRSMQRPRNARRSFRPIAKMDVISVPRPLVSGYCGVRRRFAFDENNASEKVRHSVAKLFRGRVERTQQVVQEFLRLVVSPGVRALIARDGKYILVAEDFLQRLFFCRERVRQSFETNRRSA